MKKIMCLASVVAACGGGSSSSVPIDKLGPSLISALCDFEVRCDATPDHATCQQLFAVDSNIDGLVTDVNNHVINYDPTLAADCINDISTVSCDGTSYNEEAKWNDECKRAIVGTVAQGGACVNGGECVSGSCNIPPCTAQCCQGTCDPSGPQPTPDGGDCSQTYSCQGTDVCVFDTTGLTATCQARLPAGSACTTDECAEGYLCAGVDPTTGSGTCQKPKAVGESCTGDGECAGTLNCGSSGTCVAPADVGASCATVNCVNWARCDTTSMTCVEYALPGAACDDSTGDYCLAGQCDATTSKCPTSTTSCSLP
jgi:hypothetical protein